VKFLSHERGQFLGVRIRSFGNLGAFVSFRGAMPPVVNIGTVCGVTGAPGGPLLQTRQAVGVP
jgi:hypothetical protein